MQHPLKVYDLGIMPTPALYYTVANLQMYTIGIMITASHNQYHDNGLKIITTQGKLTASDEQAIVDSYHTLNHLPDYDNVGTTYHEDMPIEFYLAALKEKFPKNFLKKTKIVIDCANGAYSQYAPDILEHFGAHIIPLHTKPNGKNINLHAGSQYPQKIITAVLEHQADVGIAFDGDGDRVIFINRHGVIKDGDDLLALLNNHPAYQKQPTIVGTIMSNQGLEQHFTTIGKKFLRTPVGDKNVVQALLKEQLLLGAEPSGHVILRDFSDTSDGLFTTLRALEIITSTKNWDITTFTKFSQYSVTIPVSVKRNLLEEPLRSIIEHHKQEIAKNGGRLIVRYSGTESILRVMVEGQDATKIRTLGAVLSEQLQVVL